VAQGSEAGGDAAAAAFSAGLHGLARLMLDPADTAGELAGGPPGADASWTAWADTGGGSPAAVSARALSLQLLLALGCVAACPASLLLRRKERLPQLALLLACAGLLIHAGLHTPASHLVASLLLGGAYGLANAYSSTLWEYFFGPSDAARIRQTSLAITSATSGSAVWVFGICRESSGHYRSAMRGCAAVALLLAALDCLLLAKPETLEAIVRQAPTWEQLLARRQRNHYFSVLAQLARLVELTGLGRGGRWARRRHYEHAMGGEVPLEAAGI